VKDANLFWTLEDEMDANGGYEAYKRGSFSRDPWLRVIAEVFFGDWIGDTLLGAAFPFEVRSREQWAGPKQFSFIPQ